MNWYWSSTTQTATPSSTGRPALPFEIQRVCGSKMENTFVLVRNPLSLQQTPVDLVDLASRVVDVAPGSSGIPLPRRLSRPVP